VKLLPNKFLPTPKGRARLSPARRSGSHRRFTLAFTLVEALIVMAIASIFITVMVSMSLTTGRSFAEIVNYVDLDHNNRLALDNLSREIRQVSFLSSFDPASVTFMDNDGQPVTYQYSSSNRSLTRTKNGTSTLLLNECDSLQFSMYQRAPLTNSYDLIPVTEVTNCKVIGINWTCSRSLFGRRANTEPAQAAKIVLRNKQQ